jgi:hypothetical protein
VAIRFYLPSSPRRVGATLSSLFLSFVNAACGFRFSRRWSPKSCCSSCRFSLENAIRFC